MHSLQFRSCLRNHTSESIRKKQPTQNNATPLNETRAMHRCIPDLTNDVLVYFLLKTSPLYQKEKDESPNTVQGAKFISLKKYLYRVLSQISPVKRKKFKRNKYALLFTFFRKIIIIRHILYSANLQGCMLGLVNNKLQTPC